MAIAIAHSRQAIAPAGPRQGKPGLMLSTEDEVTNQDGVVVLTFARRILISDPR